MTTNAKIRVPQYIAMTAKRTAEKLGEGWKMELTTSKGEDCTFINYEFIRESEDTISSWDVERISLMAKACDGNWYVTTHLEDPTKLVIRVYMIIYNK